MKKTIIPLSMFLLCFLHFSIPVRSISRSRDTKFIITINVFLKGKYETYTYRVTSENLRAVKYSTTSRHPDTIIKRKLTDDEKEAFVIRMTSFPLNRLAASYINHDVRGEVHVVYTIEINGRKKRVLVYYHDQPDLKALYKAVIQMVPADVRFAYYGE